MAELEQSRICKGCWEQMHVPVPIRGVLSVPFRAFGVRPSRMNPNTCTICELMFTKVMRARKITIDATIMFADLRGYTSLSQSQSSDAVSSLLDAFYDECANAIWAHEGILNKTIGDAVMAVFNFPLVRNEHAGNAVRAARDIQQNWRERREALVAAHGLNASELGIGIGIHSGEFWRVRPYPSGPDGDRHGGKHRLAGPVGCRGRPDTGDAGSVSARPTGPEGQPLEGIPTQGVQCSDRALRSIAQSARSPTVTDTASRSKLSNSRSTPRSAVLSPGSR